MGNDYKPFKKSESAGWKGHKDAKKVKSSRNGVFQDRRIVYLSNLYKLQELTTNDSGVYDKDGV